MQPTIDHGSFLSAAIVCAAFMGCVNSPPNYKRLNFVFPAEFKGPFVILESHNGVQLNASESNCELKIPASRVLLVHPTNPFHQPRRWFAMSTTGQAIKVDEPDDAEIALRGGRHATRTGHPPRFEFFVGTLDEYERFDFANWRPPITSTQ